MALPGDLTTATITGQFTSASGAPVTGSVTFSPTSTLLDPTSQTVFPASGSSYPLSSMGTFQSDPLICTDNVDLEPQGWLYVVKVELQDLQPYSFTTALPSSPSTVDISALEPVSVSIGGAPLTPVASGAYLPSGGGTETGTLVLDASPPIKVPGAGAGQILVSDGSGNFTPQANATGSATSLDGLPITGTIAPGRVLVVGSGSTAVTWTLPLQIDQTSGDIAALTVGPTGSWGSLSQAAAADHQHPTTGLVDTTSTQSIAGVKTFSGEVIVPTPSAAGDAATKAYVDASAAGLSVKLAVQEATTAALSPANTYSNGTSGVGATLTATGNGTLTVDGHLVALNDRVLVKNEAAPANNGIYLCTTAGTSGVPYVLTRATDMDQAAEIPGAFAFVVNGTQAGYSFAVTDSGPYTVGTTAIGWTVFSQPAAVTAGNSGISVAGSAVSLVTPVATLNGGTGVSASTPAATLAAMGAAPALGGTGWLNATQAPYSAVGNGTTDDTSQIQSALTAAGAAGGGVVYLPAGTYKITPPSATVPALTVPSGVTIQGDGLAATVLLKGGNGILLDFSGAGPFSETTSWNKYQGLRDLEINGNGKTGLVLRLYYVQFYNEYNVYINSNADVSVDMVQCWDSRATNGLYLGGGSASASAISGGQACMHLIRNSAAPATTLSAGISGTITALPVVALDAALPAGIVQVWNGAGQMQNFTTTGAAAAATSIPVSSVAVAHTFISGNAVNGFGWSGDNTNALTMQGCHWEANESGAIWMLKGTDNTSSLNNIFITDSKCEQDGIGYNCPLIQVDSGDNIQIDHIYVFAGGFTGGFSTPVTGIRWHVNVGTLTDVFMSNGSHATISNGIDIAAGSTTQVTNVTQTWTTSPTVAGVNVTGGSLAYLESIKFLGTFTTGLTGSPYSLAGALAGDVTGTEGATTVAKIQGTTVQTPAGGATSYLDATGHWTTPAAGSSSLDTTHNPAALGSANPGLGSNGASPSDHVHPTTGLLTTGALVAPTQGGTGVNASTSGLSLAAMAGTPGGATSAQYLKGGGTGGAIVASSIAPADMPIASTAAQGAVTFDGPLATDIQPSPGTAAAGGAGTAKLAAYSDHVHGQPPMLAPTGLTGATTPTRYIGGVAGAAPTGGTYVAGDYAVDKNGGIWICTTGSTPGPVVWAHVVAGTGVLTNPLTAVGDIIRGGTVTSGTAALTRLGIGTTGQVLTVSGGIPAWQSPSAGTDWLNAVTQYGADNTGVANADSQIQTALNAAPFGGTVYLPAGTYKISKPVIIPPAVTLLGSGQSFAYDGGSQPMTISTSVLVPSSTFATQAYGGQTVSGVLAMLGITLNGGGFFDTSFSFTATNASPCVFTAAGSSYSNGAQVVLTGSVPTGFTAGTIYYVVSVSGTTFRLAATSGGSAINSTSTGSGTVKQEWGSANQVIRNITINGTGGPTGVRGIEAWGAVWGVRIEDVGIFHMPDSGIFTSNTAAGSDTAHFPDVWQMTGVHVAACKNDGIHMTAIGDSYFTACESTGNFAAGGNFANGWTISGDNIKMTACKAEYNTGIGLVISRGNAARPILVNGFGTDGNGHGGIQITGTGGAGPVVLNGIGLNYDGQNNGAGGNWAALSITGGAHVTVTGLHVTTGIAGASHLFPQYGVQCPSTFTGVLQIENSEIYGGTAAVNLDTGATGVVRYGPNVLTGSGDWSAQSLTNVVHAPSPQTDAQQYAKYWSTSAGNWVTSTTQQPRESMPWYAVSGNPTIASGQMLCAAIPVMPGDQISKLGFVVGATAASLTAGGSGPHWWVALYTAGGAQLIGQSSDQGAALLSANTPHLLPLTAASGFTIPYLVPAGVYSLLGVVMVNSNGGTQPSLRGISQQAVLNGGAGDLFPGSTTYAATVGAAGSNGGASPPAGPLTLSVATSFAYMGAC